MRQSFQRRLKSRGVALIELALILPIVMVLIFATLEISKAVSEYKVITNQVRAAARFLMTRTPATGVEQAKCIVRYGSPDVVVSNQGVVLSCGAAASLAPVLPGLSESAISTQVVIIDSRTNPATHLSQTATYGGVSTTLNLVTVEVRGYQYQLFTGVNIGDYFPALKGVTAIGFDPIKTTVRQVSG